MAILLPVSVFSQEYSVRWHHILNCFLHVALEYLKHKETLVPDQRCFICSTAAVLSKVHSHPEFLSQLQVK